MSTAFADADYAPSSTSYSTAYSIPVAASPAPVPGGIACAACTFVNAPTVGICGMCGRRTTTASEIAARARAAMPVSEKLAECAALIDVLESEFLELSSVGCPPSLSASLTPVQGAVSALSGMHSRLASLDGKLDALEVDGETRIARKAQLRRLERLIGIVERCASVLKTSSPSLTPGGIVDLITTVL